MARLGGRCQRVSTALLAPRSRQRNQLRLRDTFASVAHRVATHRDRPSTKCWSRGARAGAPIRWIRGPRTFLRTRPVARAVAPASSTAGPAPSRNVVRPRVPRRRRSDPHGTSARHGSGGSRSRCTRWHPSRRRSRQYLPRVPARHVDERVDAALDHLCGFDVP